MTSQLDNELIHSDDESSFESSSSSDHWTPRDRACASNSREKEEHLLIDLIGDGRWDDAMSRLTIIEGGEEIRRKGGEDCSLPLHHACRCRAPYDLVEAILGQWPEAAKVKDINGSLPIHVACNPWYGVSGDLPLHLVACSHYYCDDDSFLRVVQLLLDTYPEGAKVFGEFNSLPLHLLFGFYPRKDSVDLSPLIVRLLLDAYPEGVKAVGGPDQQLPLHLACLRASDEVVVMILLEYPKAVKVKDGKGQLPIHTACCRTSSLGSYENYAVLPSTQQVVQLLLKAYPEGVKTTTNNGSLPLHYATNSVFPSNILRMLLHAYPKGAATRCRRGKFPIQHMVETVVGAYFDEEVSLDLESDVIEVLLQPILNNEPECEADNDMILLFIAIDFGLSVDVIRSLLATYPEAVRTRFNIGFPLHRAAECLAPLEVLNLLIDSYPEGACATGMQGYLPLHLLARKASPENEQDVEKVKALLKPLLYDEKACIRPRWGDFQKTPLDIASEFNALSLLTCVEIENCAPSAMLQVLRRHPEQVRSKDAFGNSPLHLAAGNPTLNGVKILSRGLRRKTSGYDEGGVTSGLGGIVERYESSIVDRSDSATDDAQSKLNLIDLLVEMYPEAAGAPNSEGRFPLSLAIESGKKWHEGIEAITDAAGKVIVYKDKATELYPFMLAAVCGTEESSTDSDLKKRSDDESNHDDGIGWSSYDDSSCDESINWRRDESDSEISDMSTGGGERAVNAACLTTVYCLFRRCPELKRYVTK